MQYSWQELKHHDLLPKNIPLGSNENSVVLE